MDGYGIFAGYYDELTSNIDYKEQADFFDKIIRKYGKNGGILLDLACGTGSLSEELARLGYDVIGVDNSSEMLSEAFTKKMNSGLPVQYLCQDMTELDLYGTVDITVCALDSLNHLPDLESIGKAVSRVAFFCEPESIFIFDMNMPKKHRCTLADRTFVYDTENVCCIWQNEYIPESSDNRVDISLDFFEKQENGSYERYSESFSEIAFDRSIIEEIVCGCGFEILEEIDYDTKGCPDEASDKIIFVCRMPEEAVIQKKV